MAGKYGSASQVLLVNGYNMLADKITAARFKFISEIEETTGLGDSFKELTPTGMKSFELVQEGALWDTTDNQSHEAVIGTAPTTPQTSSRVVCIGMAGNTIDLPAVGLEGTFTVDDEVLATQGALTRANLTYQGTGQFDAGNILQPLAAKTADWNTESDSLDNAGSSANGGVGYLQCTAAATFSNFVGTIQDSADDSAWTSLIAFADNVTAPFAERKTVSGTVDRYLSFDGNVTGSGSISVFCLFSRS